MCVDLAEMIADDLRSGPGADFGRTLVFEQSNKRGRQTFSVSAAPVSGIPTAESGKIDADFDSWTAQCVVPIADCTYQPDVGQRVTISATTTLPETKCRITRVTPDPMGGVYAIDLEPITRG
jgi:hypothetical protein